MKRALVTGVAGFIGFHLTRRLLDLGVEVVGVDSMNAYYDPTLKEARLRQLQARPGFIFERLDLADRTATAALFTRHAVDRVAHLAAQAGVRYSLTNPHAYADANLVGFLNILEGCRAAQVPHLTYASTSSVYGANVEMPFSEHHGVDHPISLYAASKRANELMAHAYSHLFALPCTGLRFFTVYGPWGRPDMALFIFTKAMLEDRPIPVFNHGNMERDFTYVDDIVEAFARVMDHVPEARPEDRARLADPAVSTAPFRIYNVGHQKPVALMAMVRALEQALGRTARLDPQPMQPGDVTATWADVSDLERDTGFRPRVTIEEGVPRFVAWYREYYGV